MTTPTFRQAPDGAQARTVQVREPGELIAAVPALLGYHPENSLILVSLGGPDHTELRTVLRHDLVVPAVGACGSDDDTVPLDGLVEMTAVIDRYARRLVAEHSTAAVAIVVDAGAGSRRAAHRDLIAALRTRLQSSGVTLSASFATTEIARGVKWFGIGEPRWAGVVADPDTSEVTVAQVYAGRQIRRSRRDVEALVAADADRQAQVRALLRAAAASGDLEASLDAAGGDAYHRRKLEEVLRQIANLAAGEPLLAVELAELGMALRRTVVRDSLLALAAGDMAAAAERLWMALTRALPEPERAEPAVLLAYSALLRGDGTLTGIALDAALDAAPWHRLAILLERSLNVAIDRARLLEPALVGYDTALALGVRLPRIDTEDDITPA
jgi:hypothetical protein